MVKILGVGFHAYGLLIGVGSWLAYEASVWAGKKVGVEKKVIEDGLIWILVSSVVGARIYHVIDLWEWYGDNWVKIFFVWEGGLGIWGGLIGGMIGVIAYQRLWLKERGIGLLRLLDVAVIGIPLAQAVGRWGNYINGELYGRVTTLPWGISVAGAANKVHPLFLYESVLSLVLFLGLVWMVKSNTHQTGRIFSFYLIGYGVIRFLLEPLRPDDIVWSVLGLPVAQILSAVAIASGVALWHKKTHK